MAEHLKKILGDMLYLVDPDENMMEFLPSPDELQGKILVKAKKTSVKSPVTNTVPMPPPIKEEEEEEKEKTSNEKDIDSTLDGDTSPSKANSIPGVDDGLLHPKTQRWAGPPKVHWFTFYSIFLWNFSKRDGTQWYGQACKFDTFTS